MRLQPLTVVLLVVLVAIVSASHEDEIQHALKKAKGKVEAAIDKTDEREAQKKHRLRPSDLFQSLRRARSKKARKISEAAEVVEASIRYLENEGIEFKTLSEGQAEEIFQLAGCLEPNPQIDSCDSAFYRKYRTLDGTCNNEKYPMYGAALMPYRRMAPAFYENGVNLPRGWTPGVLYNGFELPNPRDVSLNVVSSNITLDDDSYSLMVFQWGQFVDHDITHTPQVAANVELENLESCSDVCTNTFPCFPIFCGINDPRVPQGQCIGSTRSSGVCVTNHRCKQYQREQVNSITAYVDASNVYGSEYETNDKVREAGTPFLRVSAPAVVGGKPMLPFVEGNDTDCIQNPNGASFVPCFYAGDVRANEQTQLSTMHTIWMREHNRVAARLAQLNPKWSAEKVYQEARKIIIAEMQIITFRDWLPNIIGPDAVDAFGKFKYNKHIDPSISNEFATAGYRLHNLVRPIMYRLDENLLPTKYGPLPLHQMFFSAFRLKEEGGTDDYLRGLYGVPGRQMLPEDIMTSELTEKLFKLSTSISLDLASLNILRGRDHGLATYNTMREVCGLGRAKEFSDFADTMQDTMIEKLDIAYKHVDNVDLWVGGLSETPLPGAKVGPTFQCIIADQFLRLRDGDKFWWENRCVFKNKQKAELAKVSLARIICNNADAIDRIQPDVFRSATLVDMVPCDEIPDVDLDAWKSKPKSASQTKEL